MNILTFDIEEWFHLLDHPGTQTEDDWAKFPIRIHENMDRIMEMLAENKQSATFFCLGWVARKYPEIIRQISDAGYEIATHSDLHQLAYQQNRNQFSEDLSRSIQSLESLTGKKIRAYRAPGFSLKEENKWVFDELLSNGIEMDCSIFPAKRAHGGFENFGQQEPCWVEMNGVRLKEFPINVSSLANFPLIFSGGGYFRLFPTFMLDQLWKNQSYVMTYFHPRDFDAGQPMIEDLSFLRKFKSYYGLSSAMGKLEFLIKKYPFIDLATAEQEIDWEKARVVSL
jgi:polysaccharide deacetylase family protein (PEP-CTERM system associated)